MFSKENADHTTKLFRAAIDQAGDVKAAALTLIAASMACHHMLRGVMAEVKVDHMLRALSVAGAMLLDDAKDGLLHMTTPCGSA